KTLSRTSHIYKKDNLPMAPEMFLGLGLSGLLIMMFGKSPSAPPKKEEKKAVITFVLPDGEALPLSAIKSASVK
ncbi:MAG: hypothetical protein AAFY17_02365, partial [Cyanobacteria bacterium J06642_11]